MVTHVVSLTQDNAADMHCTRDGGRGRSCGAYQRHGSFIARTKHDCTAARCIFKCNTSVSGNKLETGAFLQRKLLLRSAANCTVSVFSFWHLFGHNQFGTLPYICYYWHHGSRCSSGLCLFSLDGVLKTLDWHLVFIVRQFRSDVPEGNIWTILTFQLSESTEKF